MQIKNEKIKKEQNGTIPFCWIVLFLQSNKKSAHNDTTFKKNCLPLSRQLRQTGNIEESY